MWIRRFIPNVESAIARLEKSRNEPMAWAGARYAKYPPEQRARVEALIGAIVLHRDGDIDDNELYNILGSLRADPKDRHSGIEEENLERVMDACIDAQPLDLESTYWIPQRINAASTRKDAPAAAGARQRPAPTTRGDVTFPLVNLAKRKGYRRCSPDAGSIVR